MWSRSPRTWIARSRLFRRRGLSLRRIRELPSATGAPRQAFFRLGAEILEVVQAPGSESASQRAAHLWGLALLAEDLDRTVAYLGENVSPIRRAVQPGRRIASLRAGAGLSMPMALISARSPAAGTVAAAGDQLSR